MKVHAWGSTLGGSASRAGFRLGLQNMLPVAAHYAGPKHGLQELSPSPLCACRWPRAKQRPQRSSKATLKQQGTGHNVPA